MAAYAALLRAINVGGTGKLPMADLRQLCEACGFSGVATYIQSGNVVFQSRRAEASAQRELARALADKLGKPVGVHLRSARELDAVLKHNPFPEAPPNRVIVFFLEAALPKRALGNLEGPGGEQVVARGREVFVSYPSGQGRSKLSLPFQKTSTGRNLNTVHKLRELLRALE
jgi:uncharacterized protein (DUF1697 family)